MANTPKPVRKEAAKNLTDRKSGDQNRKAIVRNSRVTDPRDAVISKNKSGGIAPYSKTTTGSSVPVPAKKNKKKGK